MEREEKDTTEEIEEQAIRPKFREDESADEADEQADSGEGDDDSEVDEQKRVSDATLKHAIERIADAFSRLG